MRRHLEETFDNTTVLENDGDTFYIYDPHGDLPPERQIPFVTIVTGEDWEQVANLTEPGAYRLNIGLTKATYSSLSGTAPEAEVDYAARDKLMPHPTYGGQHWVCVVNPSDATVDALKPLLTEAHEFAARKHANQEARKQTRP